MIFLETSTPVSKTDIEQIEITLGIVFPKDFVDHYLVYNGGYPQPDTYKWSNGASTTVNTFYSLKYVGFGKIEEAYENLVFKEKYLPLGFIIFATDDGGNFFCLSARQIDYGKVYYLNNYHYDITEPELALTLLEDSFSDFIAHLS